MKSLYTISVFNLIRRHFQKKLRRIQEKIIENMTSSRMDTILELGLRAMSLLFFLSSEYRRNIKGFKAKIGFKTVDGKLGATAVFRNWFFRPSLKVDTRAQDDTNVTIIFKDGKAMAEFLMSPSPDIISGMLDNKLNFKGNMNYILRFVYLAMSIPYLLNIQKKDIV